MIKDSISFDDLCARFSFFGYFPVLSFGVPKVILFGALSKPLPKQQMLQHLN